MYSSCSPLRFSFSGLQSSLRSLPALRYHGGAIPDIFSYEGYSDWLKMRGRGRCYGMLWLAGT